LDKAQKEKEFNQDANWKKKNNRHLKKKKIVRKNILTNHNKEIFYFISICLLIVVAVYFALFVDDIKKIQQNKKNQINFPEKQISEETEKYVFTNSKKLVNNKNEENDKQKKSIDLKPKHRISKQIDEPIKIVEKEKIEKDDIKISLYEIKEILKRGDKLTALTLLKNYADKHKKDENALKLLAELYYNMEYYENAIFVYKKLIKLGKNIEYNYKIAVCYHYFLNNKSEALKYYKLYIAKNGLYKNKVKEIVERIKK
jgi:tetratricopeptide (TPR) repeat protein